MPNDTVTEVVLGDYLDGRIDEYLRVLRLRNPESEFQRDQLVRIAVGYGLDRIFRQHARMMVHMYGYYNRVYPAGEERMMTIESLSLSGAGFKTVEDNDVRVNEILHIRFYLDDPMETVIHKNVIVRNVRDAFIGVAFCEPEPDPRLERYMANCDR